jgi:beta-lactamase regulating signal transducer with metallopeptidase domain
MITLILKSTLAMFAAFGVVLVLRRSRASRRHLVLAALFVFLLLLPAVEKFAPRWRIEVHETDAIARVVPSAVRGSSASTQQPQSELDLTGIALRVYATGAMLLLGWLALGVLRLRRVAREGEVWLEGTATMNAIANEAGIRRPALVILSERVQVPLTFGFRTSTIVLPPKAQQWDAEELARALRHELEHVRREDWMMQLIARAACALYWPHPLAWVAWRRFCLEAERACDDAVVGTYVPDEYAGQLVMLARSVRGFTTVPALGMANRSRLALRVHAILDPLQRRGPHGRAAGVAALVVTCALLVSIAPTQFVIAAVRQVTRSPLAEALLQSVAERDVEGVERLLDAGVDVNTVVEGDGTPLIVAAWSGDRDMVAYLLRRGADIHLASPGDGNPLIAAAHRGDADMVGYLLDNGAGIEEVVPGDENALITASAQGQGDVVQLLIERGADVNARVVAERNDVRTPLRMARRGNHGDVEQMLLEAGAKD